MAHRNAASVLPEPVGAMTRVLSPSAMAAQAWACAAVGAAKVPANHSRVSALKRAERVGGLAGHLAIVPAPTDKLSDARRDGHSTQVSGAWPGDPGDGVEQRVRARVGDVVGVDRRVDDALAAHLEGEGQPAVDDDPQVALDLGVQRLADRAR